MRSFMRKLLLVIAVVVGIVVSGQFVDAKQNTTFSKGSNKSLVLELQGKPDSISKHHTYEVWHYDYNSVTISLKDGKVMKWCNTNGRLKVPAEKKVKKKTVAKDSRDKRKDDREVKTISLGVISGSRHKQGNESWRKRLATRQYQYNDPPKGYTYQQQPYDLPSYNGYGAPAYNDEERAHTNYQAENGLWEDENRIDNQPTSINCSSGWDDKGNHYAPAYTGNGDAWRSDGTFMHRVGAGFIDTGTGNFIPCH